MGEIIRPTVAAMAKEGRPFKGVLYAGLMLTATGPKLLEYNTRFGDPECQALVVRLMSDLLPALVASRDGLLGSIRSALAAQGFLDRGDGGQRLSRQLCQGQRDPRPRTAQGHGGRHRLSCRHQAKPDDGRLLADGGRVLGVTALGDTVALAQKKAYEAVDLIDWPGGFCRRDIGWRAV